MAFETKPCRACSAPMVWAVSAATGGAQPINPEPHPDGTVELTDRGPGVAPVARVVPPAEREGREDLHQAHHATCPGASRYRKRVVR